MSIKLTVAQSWQVPNEGVLHLHYPAALDEVIAVGAADFRQNRNYHSYLVAQDILEDI